MDFDFFSVAKTTPLEAANSTIHIDGQKSKPDICTFLEIYSIFLNHKDKTLCKCIKNFKVLKTYHSVII